MWREVTSALRAIKLLKLNLWIIDTDIRTHTEQFNAEEKFNSGRCVRIKPIWAVSKAMVIFMSILLMTKRIG